LSIDGILTVTCAVPELNNDRTTDGGGSDSSDDDPNEGLHIAENDDEQVQQPSVSTNYSEVIQKVNIMYKARYFEDITRPSVLYPMPVIKQLLFCQSDVNI